MGQVREVDALSDAIMETEKEIAGDAWGNEETSALDETGDRALESMGEGLEGQHEAEDDDAGSEEQEGDDEDGDEEAEEGEDGEEAEGEGEGEAAAGDGKTAGQTQTREEQQGGRVPSGKLREEAEKRRQAEARVAELEAKLAAAPAESPKIAALEAQLQQLATLLNGTRQPPQPAKDEAKVDPPEVPDIFENPKGFSDYLLNAVQQAVAPVRSDLRKTQVETSFALAHNTHKETFAEAYKAINGLNPQNPDDRAVVQRIYNSTNPGEELVKWHKRSTALARFGDDPDAAEARIREEARQALAKDPEFIKSIVSSLRQEASTGENGRPRTEVRLPPSAQRARAGSNVGVERMDHSAQDNSDQSVADAAWR
jgi:hypothetical protein